MKPQGEADDHDTFQAKLDRLKECLGVKEDQQVAAALGLSKTALSLRKNRASFPAERVYALAAERPEVDPVYVLTGDIALRGRVHSLVRDDPDLASRARSFGSTSDDQADRLAVELFHEANDLRAERRPLYAEILELLDRMSAHSVYLIRQLAEKVSFADEETRLQRLRRRREARLREGDAGQQPDPSEVPHDGGGDALERPASRQRPGSADRRRRK